MTKNDIHGTDEGLLWRKMTFMEQTKAYYDEKYTKDDITRRMWKPTTGITKSGIQLYEQVETKAAIFLIYHVFGNLPLN